MVRAMFGVMSRPEWTGRFPASLWDPAQLPFAFFDAAEYEAILKRNGYLPCRVELFHGEALHNGREGLAGSIRATWLPFIKHLPDDLREKFIAQIVDSYLETHPLNAEGRAAIPTMRLHVEASVE